jgi:hypothetical protein
MSCSFWQQTGIPNRWLDVSKNIPLDPDDLSKPEIDQMPPSIDSSQCMLPTAEYR